MVELTLMVNPLERTARLREVHALAAGDLCTLTVSGVPGALPDLQLALYRDASMESLVASVAGFSPVPGHSRDRAGTLDLGTVEMDGWFGDEVAAARGKASRRISSLGSLPSAASLSDESSDGLPQGASPDMPAEGWLVLFDAERTWVSCPVAVLLRRVEAASGGVEPVRSLLATKVDKVPSAAAGNVPVFVEGGGIADSGIPAAPDASLSAPGRPADAKAVGDALRGGYTEWEVVPDGVRLVFDEGGWYPYQGVLDIGPRRGDADSTEIEWTEAGDYVPFRIVAVRRRISPTKTSQLTNDSGFLTEHQDVSGKMDGAAAYPAWVPSSAPVAGMIRSHAGKLWECLSSTMDEPSETSGDWRLVTIDSLKQDALTFDSVPTAGSSNPVTSGGVHAALQGKADTTDLPYALVTPGEWEFGVVGAEDNPSLIFEGGSWKLYVDGVSFNSGNTSISALSVDIDTGGLLGIVTATRASLPGHLLDRAVNAVPVSTDTTLVLPPFAAGKVRDLLVRLAVSASGTVTWNAASGETVAWDAMGAPSTSFAAGTYLYRFTEVAPHVFHAADITSGGSVDPAVLDEKLDATSAAPAFDPTLTYLVGEYVTHGGVLYRCKTAVAVAGAWTGTSNWEADDMTSPDATLDIMSDGRLRVVTVAGEDLWMQGYDLESTSAQVLKCEKVNLLSFPATTASAFDSTAAYAVGDRVVHGGMVYKFTAAHSAGAWVGTDAAIDSVVLTMPYVPVGKVGDFVLDVDNSANASVKMVAELSGLFTAFDVFVDKGRNLSDLLTFDGGKQCELFFTMTAFGTQAKPAWKVVRQVVEKQEAGS